MYDFTIGCDPEYFLTDEKGKLKSAVGVIMGSKDEPVWLENGAGLQTDNVAIEFASPVADSEESFLEGIQFTFGLIKNELPKGFGFSFKPSALFPRSELNTFEAQQFGCDPDFDCWREEINESPKPKRKNLRSCGGHVHIGFVSGSGNHFLLTRQGRLDTAKICDMVLGLASVIIDNSPEAKERRELYGKAGAHRPAPYGIEYRVMSNFWTTKEESIKFVYHAVADILRIMREENWKVTLREMQVWKLVKTINEGDSVTAATLLYKYVVPMLNKKTIHYLQESIKAFSVDNVPF